MDEVCGKKFDANEMAVLKDAGNVADDDMIFDIGGPKSAKQLVDNIMKAGTVVWNGPVGVFEFDQFGAGTRKIAEAIANTNAFTLAGGGDTIAAIQHALQLTASTPRRRDARARVLDRHSARAHG